MRQQRYALAIVGLVAGCIQDHSVACEGRVCGRDTICDEIHHACIVPAQVSACDGKTDGDVCDVLGGDEVCDRGVCVIVVCGNGVTEFGEQCDDGNTVALDGCSADCLSNETCGNNVADGNLGEQCDDGNFLDHDSCSSTCIAESPRWIDRPNAPPGRHDPLAAYDSKRDRVIMLGGSTSTAFATIFKDAWAWDGRWRQLDDWPHPVLGGSLAYDALRDRVVLFGGSLADNTTLTSETWEFDGTHWSRGVDVTDQALQRMFAGMVYDPDAQRLLVFGGLNFSGGPLGPASGTYTYNGTAWTKLTTTNDPPGLRSPAMAYDPVRHVLVVQGSPDYDSGATSPVTQIWELSGTAWTKKYEQPCDTGTNAARPCAYAAMAYSPKLQTIVISGGVDRSTIAVRKEVFTWNGTTLTKLSGAPPTPRFRHALVEDSQGTLLLFGGGATTNFASPLSETWQLDGTWRQFADPDRASIALDRDRNRVVRYGGRGPQGAAGTFELVGTRWISIATTTQPQLGESYAMAYDEARKQVVLFGGYSVTATADIDETWTYESGTWTKRTVSGPSKRSSASMAYDAERKEVIMFGGCYRSPDGQTLFAIGETWRWDGTAWSQYTGPGPSPRCHAAMDYDRDRKVIVLYGGNTGTGSPDATDTWIWDGTGWQNAPAPAGVEQPHDDGVSAWNRIRRRITLITGDYSLDAWEWTGTQWSLLSIPHVYGNATSASSLIDGSGITVTVPSSDFFAGGAYDLVWDNAQPHESCAPGEDQDQDGRVMCDDPDCWATCNPELPPDATP